MAPLGTASAKIKQLSQKLSDIREAYDARLAKVGAAERAGVAAARRELESAKASVDTAKVRLAELLNVTRGAVTNWIARGVPAERAPDIEQLSRSHGDPVTCEQLCPEVNWHVVRGNPLH